ncbi:MAG: MarR family transcriptional regulator [Desulfobulbaceae bacterium]|uniref:MarR family transcriptional regulator n=1 Tax=Candidatus Desulfatifera sulfidica TaxID=2841691 RepID=A0A8J6TCR7_9BACT|nr:MarR family transcriptional regulator [Candidatus Desulfatifera sulfidica]
MGKNEINHLIIEFYEKLSSWEHSIVRGHELTLAQMHIIEILGLHKTLRMKELAEKTGVTTGSLTVVVDKLVQKEIVRRTPHESDRRSLIVELTHKGHEYFLEHDRLHSQLTEEIMHQLSSEENEQLENLLKKINQII